LEVLWTTIVLKIKIISKVKFGTTQLPFTFLNCILAKGAIAPSMTPSGGVLFAS